MQLQKFRGAVAAAATVLAVLFGTLPSAAWAQTTPPVVAAATPLSPAAPVVVATLAAPAPIPAPPAPATSGSAWIAQGTQVAAQPAAAAPAGGQAAPVHAASLIALVGDMPLDTELTGDLKCLAQAVYFEARGEPIEGQLAVAEVVINRAKSGLYPDNYCDVVTQPAQFSFVHHGRIPHADETSAAWQRAAAVAEIAEQNLWQSKAADALYFHATYVNPSWAHQKIELAQIDTHIFYR